jgi:hypothetical protein
MKAKPPQGGLGLADPIRSETVAGVFRRGGIFVSRASGSTHEGPSVRSTSQGGGFVAALSLAFLITFRKWLAVRQGRRKINHGSQSPSADSLGFA